MDRHWIPVEQLPEEMTGSNGGLKISHHVLVTDAKTQWVAFYCFVTKE